MEYDTIRLKWGLNALIVHVLVLVYLLRQQDDIGFGVPHYVVENIIILEEINLVQDNEKPCWKHLSASILQHPHIMSFAEYVGYDSIDFNLCLSRHHVNIGVRDGFYVLKGLLNDERTEHLHRSLVSIDDDVP